MTQIIARRIYPKLVNQHSNHPADANIHDHPHQFPNLLAILEEVSSFLRIKVAYLEEDNLCDKIRTYEDEVVKIFVSDVKTVSYDYCDL